MRDFLNKHIFNRKFQPSLWPTLAYIFFMLLLVSLGQWQLDRAEEKNQLFSAFESGDTAAIQLKTALNKDQARYQRIEITGRFVPEKQYLLDNIVRKGQVGFHVLSPFRESSGKTVIINRGWIPLFFKQESLNAQQELLKLNSEKLTLSGRLDKMLRPGLLLEAEIPDTAYPKTVQFPTLEQLGRDLETSLTAWQVLLDSEQLDTNVTGFVREWTPNEMGPEKHLGYAVQWYALAFTLSIIFIVLTFRPISHETHTAASKKNITDNSANK